MQAIDTQDKQFHDGNGTTELGTILPAWWLNQIQAEILAVLTTTNIAPNKAKTNQLAEAIQKLFPTKHFTLTAGAGLTGGGDLSANRTIALATPATLSGSTTNASGNAQTGHTHEIAKASPTVAGVVKLINALNHDATDAALTAAQGKTLAQQIASVSSGSLKVRSRLTTQDLNDLIGEAHYGLWHNEANANATTERHYPIDRAGTLFVLPAAYQGIQIYIPFDQNTFYVRHSTHHRNGTLSSWRMIGETINTLNSDSTTAALSAAMGKTLNDEKLGKRGNQTLSGSLKVGEANQWTKLQFPVESGGQWIFETNPKSALSTEGSVRLNLRYLENNQSRYIHFPDVRQANQTVAYQTWVNGAFVKKSGDAITGYLTINQQAYPKLQLASNRGEEAMLLESGGQSGTHGLIIRRHQNGAVGASNADNDIAKFMLPNQRGRQVLTTLSDFPATLAETGYQKCPSGLIWQWGKTERAGETLQNITFPIAFPNACLNAQATAIHNGVVGGSSVLGAHIGSVSRTGLSCAAPENGGHGQAIYWFAIGH